MSVVAGLASYSAAVAAAAAAAFAVSTTLTHRSAGEVLDAQGFQLRQLLGLIRATLAHPYWLGGIALSMVGLGLHAFALNGGALAVVQLLMVLGLLFALPLQRRLRHERILPHRAVVGVHAGPRPAASCLWPQRASRDPRELRSRAGQRGWSTHRRHGGGVCALLA
ncbi:MAG TPA: hypothetical protein VIY28_07070, partial [Pseudonocardiaceae bacterium]